MTVVCTRTSSFYMPIYIHHRHGVNVWCSDRHCLILGFLDDAGEVNMKNVYVLGMFSAQWIIYLPTTHGVVTCYMYTYNTK